MKYSIRLHAKLGDDFASIPLSTQPRLREALHSLAATPRPPGVKKLTNIRPGINNAYRIRVGAYRICYQIFDRELVVSVVAAGKRADIYPLLKRRLH